MAHALTGFGVIYAGKLWLEHEIAAALVSELLFLASASGWAVSVIALYRTLEGHGPAPIPALRFPQSRTCALMTGQLERLYRK